MLYVLIKEINPAPLECWSYTRTAIFSAITRSIVTEKAERWKSLRRLETSILSCFWFDFQNSQSCDFPEFLIQKFECWNSRVNKIARKQIWNSETEFADTLYIYVSVSTLCLQSGGHILQEKVFPHFNMAVYLFVYFIVIVKLRIKVRQG